MSEFQYPIFEDRKYMLDYGDGLVYHVSGTAILNMFRREALMDQWLNDDYEWNNIDDIYYNSDLGEI